MFSLLAGTSFKAENTESSSKKEELPKFFLDGDFYSLDDIIIHWAGNIGNHQVQEVLEEIKEVAEQIQDSLEGDNP